MRNGLQIDLRSGRSQQTADGDPGAAGRVVLRCGEPCLSAAAHPRRLYRHARLLLPAADPGAPGAGSPTQRSHSALQPASHDRRASHILPPLKHWTRPSFVAGSWQPMGSQTVNVVLTPYQEEFTLRWSWDDFNFLVEATERDGRFVLLDAPRRCSRAQPLYWSFPGAPGEWGEPDFVRATWEPQAPPAGTAYLFTAYFTGRGAGLGTPLEHWEGPFTPGQPPPLNRDLPIKRNRPSSLSTGVDR